MTDEQIALARRAVACKGWRWMPGMFTEDGFRVCRVDTDGYKFGYRTEYNYAYAVIGDVLPDLDDPATRGCLLTLVREAWGDQVLTCARVDVLDDYIAPLPGGYPYSVVREGRKKVFRRYFGSEVEALVAALEAAQ